MMNWRSWDKVVRAHHILAEAVLLLIVVLLPVLLAGQAHAVSKTWDGGCGVDTTWSCANNWSDNIVPASGDTVTFNGTSTNDSVVDSATFAGTVTTLNISAGYTGTLSLNRSLTVSGAFTQNAGTFTANAQTVNLGSLTIGGGIFNASSGTISDNGGLTITAGTFNANSGTMDFTGSTVTSLSCNNVTFNLVTFTNSATKTVNSNCSLPLGSNPTLAAGGLTLNGTLSGTGTLTKSGNFTLGSGGSLSGFSGLSANALTVSGTYNFGAYTTFSLGGDFILSSGGVFTAPTGTASFGNTFTISSGSTFNANGGTVNFNGVATATISCNNATFNLVTFTQTSNTRTVASDCSLPLGNNPTLGASAVSLNGTLTGTGTINKSVGSITLGATGSLSGFTGLSTVGTLAVNGTYDFSSYTTFTIGGTTTINSPSSVTVPTAGAIFAGSFTLASGATLTIPSGTSTFTGAFTLNSGSTFNANGGTVNFGGTTNSARAIACGNKTFNLVTFTHTDGTDTVGSDCSLPLGANPNISKSVTLNGVLSGSGTLTAGGTLTLNNGGSLSGFSGLSASVLVINGTYNFGTYTTFTIASTTTINSPANVTAPTAGASFLGALTVGAGATFTAPSGIAHLERSLTLDSASTFNANGGTMDFTGTGLVALACGNKTFNFVTFTNGGTKTVGSDCTMPVGNNPAIGTAPNGGLTLNGTLTGSGTINKAQGVFTLNSGSVLSGFSGLTTVGSLSINSVATDFSGYSPFSVGASFALHSGAVFTAPANATFNGNFTVDSGTTFNPNNGTVTIVANSNTTTPAGTTTITGDTTFHNLTLSSGSTSTIVFTAGSTQTVTGALSMSGSSSGLLSFISTSPGSPWFLQLSAGMGTSYVNVSDSHVLGASITACDSTDSGGNSGWVFNPASCHANDPATTPVITNFALYQASLLNQAAQNSRNEASTQPPGDDSLPSKIYDFARKFPAGKSLVTAAENFLKALLVGVILGGLIGFFLVWKRRHKDDEEELPDAANTLIAPASPTLLTPPPGAPLPGSTVQPRVSKESTPQDPLTGTSQKPEAPIGSNQGSPEPDNPPSKEDHDELA